MRRGGPASAPLNSFLKVGATQVETAVRWVTPHRVIVYRVRFLRCTIFTMAKTVFAEKSHLFVHNYTLASALWRR